MTLNTKSFWGYVLLAFGIGTIPSMISTYTTGMIGGAMVTTIISLVLIILGSYLISSK